MQIRMLKRHAFYNKEKKEQIYKNIYIRKYMRIIKRALFFQWYSIMIILVCYLLNPNQAVSIRRRGYNFDVIRYIQEVGVTVSNVLIARRTRRGDGARPVSEVGTEISIER